MADGTKTAGTRAKARDLLASVADSPGQTAVALGCLGAVSLTSPTMAVASAAVGAALLLRRPRRPVGLLGAWSMPGVPAQRYDPWQTYLVGRHAETGEPLRLTSDQLRQHCLLVGGSRQHRSEVIGGMVAALVECGSGVIHVSATGDDAAAVRLRDVAQRNGREDDFLLLDLRPAGIAGRSNTFNPFSHRGPDALAGTLVDLMDPADMPDQRVWKARAMAFMTGLMRALAWSRGMGTPLVPSRIVAHLDFDALMGIAQGQGEWQGLPAADRAATRSYLESLVGYVEARGSRQSQAVQEQHAYLAAAFRRLLKPFAEDYAHVFEHPVGDIEISDLVRQRRILAVVLPAEGEAQPILGRMTVAAVKATMHAILFDDPERDQGATAQERVIGHPHPYMCALEEIGAYAVEGLALMAAQARAIGCSMAYSAEDIPSLALLAPREAANIIANTNLKIALAPAGADGEPEGAAAGPVGSLLYKDMTIPFQSLPVGSGLFASRIPGWSRDAAPSLMSA